ncbi:MAG: methyltransferase domain-containing protein [Leptolyngbyaceae bacterium]|nr:methyltransferase domain-containing protein [Leptolyngbyaceae bacterium]
METIPGYHTCEHELISGEFEKTIAQLELWIEQKPGEVRYFHLIGLAFLLQGQELEALNAWAIPMAEESNPMYEETYVTSLIDFLDQWAQRYYKLGYFEYSELILDTIVTHLIDFSKSSPSDEPIVNIYLKLGTTQTHLRKKQAAIATYEGILQYKPNHAESYYRIGRTLLLQEEYFSAFENFYRAVQHSPENLAYRQYFSYSLSCIHFDNVSDALKQEILKCFQENAIHKNNLFIATLSILKIHPTFREVLLFTERRHFSGVINLLQNGQLTSIFGNDLFLLLLKETLVTDLNLELLLMCIRRFILLNYESLDASANSSIFQVACAIALQSFNNEYVLYAEQDELDRRDELERQLTQYLSSHNSDAGHSFIEQPEEIQQSEELEWKLVVFGMYDSLLNLEGTNSKFHSTGWSSDFSLLYTRAIANHHIEQTQKSDIVSLTPSPTHNAISASVQQQYHENPYPRWLNLTCWPPESLRVELKTLYPHLNLNPFQLSGSFQLLIAGCGTGSEAIQVATRYEDIHVLAVDISLSSLAYAKRMSSQLNVRNIEYRQADILLLDNLNQTFPVIFSTGVLHHLSDPLKGWEILANLLEPNGFMRIGLYSEIARRHIVQIREKIKALNIRPTPESIRNFRYELSCSKESSLRSVMRYTDFFSMSGCRDLLFHVNEYRFTIPMIKETLEKLGLIFIGFDLPSVLIATQYRQQFPDDPTMQNLDYWDEFEQANPDTFMSMYLFWCQKKIDSNE